ncbi:hypothetical protein QA640_34695 [Bradyrhizobium sp. CB82]|uniref:hypothetical protein n=1 Tax=Bradyrhizobium sp. CB82 TaxID=3039159 RepID=UPI0024B147FE|nr:hypothetical protein [Bradyrhizobium sp. CB82]WFU39471.1 hypothetical protein QA640_34695 [Bradyrhizobium sp. CB82]
MALAFARKPVTFRKISLFRCLTMRGVIAAFTLSAFLVQPAVAQGVKDPANFPGKSAQDSKKAQSAQDPSRPTTIRNFATGSLPSGMAAQRVWKDGKLTTIPRY